MKKILLGLSVFGIFATAMATPVPAEWNQNYWQTARQQAACNRGPVPSQAKDEQLVRRDIQHELNNNGGEPRYYVSSDGDAFKYASDSAKQGPNGIVSCPR